MLLTSPFNETHTNNPYYTNLYNQANATASGSSPQKELLYKMQEFDFNEGGYIIPAFVDSLDAYSDTGQNRSAPVQLRYGELVLHLTGGVAGRRSWED